MFPNFKETYSKRKQMGGEGREGDNEEKGGQEPRKKKEWKEAKQEKHHRSY